MQLKIYLSQVVYTSLFGHVCSWWRWRWCESWFTHIHIHIYNHIHILCWTAVCLPVVPVDVPRINCVWLIENLHKINFNWKSCRQLVPDKKRLSEHSHIHTFTFTFTHTQLTDIHSSVLCSLARQILAFSLQSFKILKSRFQFPSDLKL